MNCFDCDAAGHPTAAVAVCRSCGVGMCAAHSTVLPNPVRRINGLGLTTLPRAARRMHCPTCSAAHSSRR